MKTELINFKKPFKLIQLFRNINTYGKDEKSFELRKDKIAWKLIQSTSGFVKDSILHLPETILAKPNLQQSDLILMIDDNFKSPQNVVYTEEKSLNFSKNQTINFDFIEIKLAGVIEIYLKPGYFETGIPKRHDFKVAELVKEKPIGIKINGKRDFSLTGRRERIFTEQEYILAYLGEFNEIQFEHDLKPIQKTIPNDYKVINLMKTLY